MNPNTETKNKKWYDQGFGLEVHNAIQKRYPMAWRVLYHKGGIATGHWIIFGHTFHKDDKKHLKNVTDILNLYKTEEEFLGDK